VPDETPAHSAHLQSSGDAKDAQLDAFRVAPGAGPLTTQQGVVVDDTDNSLRAGERGPTLLEDFQLREKITHFDHERIPERVVHARGAGAYGHFQLIEPLGEYTCADFLSRPGARTPVFVRFSTVQGPRGSADTVRDVRGFATKFYTRHGNYDLVGNNMPVFFIQDAIKFPDFVHAVKPEPHREIPTGASAHDTFWDFCSLQSESTHMLMWVMSDRGIPRSYRTMQGFGVHTFRLVNADGVGTFVKFHWRPVLGTLSQVWDEAQLTAGRDPDFHRRDLWDAIEAGHHPAWDLGVQLVSEQDESAFDFDLLDPTKLIPEELVPVRTVGRMTLERNPGNFFAETEQVAFHTANLVPGIDFSNDALLQGRNFSYLDTQLIRLGGPNFAQLPVNRPLAPVQHNQRDGYGQHQVHPGQASYAPNSLGGTQAAEPGSATVYRHYQRRVDGESIRRRSPSFADHYSQATLFWNSMSPWEREHIVSAFVFELGHVESAQIRARMVDNLTRVDGELASRVAGALGVPLPAEGATRQGRQNPESSREGQRGAEQAWDGKASSTSPALSQANLLSEHLDGRKVALLRPHHSDSDSGTDSGTGPMESELRDQLAARGVELKILVPDHPGRDETLLTLDSSTFYDAVAILGDARSWLAADPPARRLVEEAYRHGKPLAVLSERADEILAELGGLMPRAELRHDDGVIVQSNPADSTSAFTQRLLSALMHHRFPHRAQA
jgi:catalase